MSETEPLFILEGPRPSRRGEERNKGSQEEQSPRSPSLYFRKVEAGFWEGPRIKKWPPPSPRLLSEAFGRVILFGQTPSDEKIVAALDLGSFHAAVRDTLRKHPNFPAGETKTTIYPIYITVDDIYGRSQIIAFPPSEFKKITQLNSRISEKGHTRRSGGLGKLTIKRRVLNNYHFSYDNGVLELTNPSSNRYFTFGPVNKAFVKMLYTKAREARRRNRGKDTGATILIRWDPKRRKWHSTEIKPKQAENITIAQLAQWDPKRRRWHLIEVKLPYKAFKGLLPFPSKILPTREQPKAKEAVVLPTEVIGFLSAEEKTISAIKTRAWLSVAALSLLTATIFPSTLTILSRGYRDLQRDFLADLYPPKFARLIDTMRFARFWAFWDRKWLKPIIDGLYIVGGGAALKAFRLSRQHPKPRHVNFNSHQGIKRL